MTTQCQCLIVRESCRRSCRDKKKYGRVSKPEKCISDEYEHLRCPCGKDRLCCIVRYYFTCGGVGCAEKRVKWGRSFGYRLVPNEGVTEIPERLEMNMFDEGILVHPPSKFKVCKKTSS